MSPTKVGFISSERSHGSNTARPERREFGNGPRKESTGRDFGKHRPHDRDRGPARGHGHDHARGAAKGQERSGSTRLPQFAPMNAREAAFKVLNDFTMGRGELERIINAVFERATINFKDKKLAYEIVYGALRNKSYLDFIIDQFLDERLKGEMTIRFSIQIALYQIIYLDKIPTHAAVDASVELMKISKDTRKFSGAVNGVLRRILSQKKEAYKIPENMEKTERLALEFSHPIWMIERWNEQYGTAKTKKLLKWNNVRPVNYIRWNSTMVPQKAFESDIASLTETTPQGVGFEKRYYKITDNVMPADIEAFKAGACTVQSPSSGWPVAMLGCKVGDAVLDIAAAPGGKTTLIAEIVGKDGVVVACDNNPKRMRMILDNTDRLKLTDRIFPLLMDGADLALTKHFDRVLLDAPCSGTGVIQRHPEGRWNRTPAEIEHVVKLQARMLDQAATLVKRGGVLVYSTCSLEKEENWLQVERFLENHKDFKLENADSFADRKFVDINGCLAITPHDHGFDGMFAARLVKTKVPTEPK